MENYYYRKLKAADKEMFQIDSCLNTKKFYRIFKERLCLKELRNTNQTHLKKNLSSSSSSSPRTLPRVFSSISTPGSVSCHLY